jgi:hypothetical protein
MWSSDCVPAPPPLTPTASPRLPNSSAWWRPPPHCHRWTSPTPERAQLRNGLSDKSRRCFSKWAALTCECATTSSSSSRVPPASPDHLQPCRPPAYHPLAPSLHRPTSPACRQPSAPLSPRHTAAHRRANRPHLHHLYTPDKLVGVPSLPPPKPQNPNSIGGPAATAPINPPPCEEATPAAASPRPPPTSATAMDTPSASTRTQMSSDCSHKEEEYSGPGHARSHINAVVRLGAL